MNPNFYIRKAFTNDLYTKFVLHEFINEVDCLNFMIKLTECRSSDFILSKVTKHKACDCRMVGICKGMINAVLLL